MSIKEMANLISKLEHEKSILKQKVRLLRSLVDFGEIYVKTSSRDCDGVSAYSNYIFTSINEYDETYDSWVDSLEGPSNWSVVSTKEDLWDEEECGTFGQGWGIN